MLPWGTLRCLTARREKALEYGSKRNVRWFFSKILGVNNIGQQAPVGLAGIPPLLTLESVAFHVAIAMIP